MVDLAERLGLAAVEPTPQHVIMVAEIGGQLVGLLVSAVSDILTVAEGALQTTPALASDLAKAYLEGMLTVERRMIGLLRTDQLLPECSAGPGDLAYAA